MSQQHVRQGQKDAQQNRPVKKQSDVGNAKEYQDYLKGRNGK